MSKEIYLKDSFLEMFLFRGVGNKDASNKYVWKKNTNAGPTMPHMDLILTDTEKGDT